MARHWIVATLTLLAACVVLVTLLIDSPYRPDVQTFSPASGNNKIIICDFDMFCDIDLATFNVKNRM